MAEALIPTNALPVTVALAKVNAERPAWPTHLVSAVADPSRCPAELLGYLAWALSVDIWSDAWTERMKRYVVGRALQDHRLKGTLALHERYARYVDAKIIRVVAPPQRFVLGRARTPAARAKLYGRLPEIRIYPEAERRPARGAFWGRFAWSAKRARRGSVAASAHEARAELRRDGKVIRLRSAAVTPSNIDDDTAPFERLYIPREAPQARVFGRLRSRAFWTNHQAARFVISFYRSKDLNLGRTAVRTGLTPLTADPERIMPKRRAPIEKSFFGRRRWRHALIATIAPKRIYDRLRLWDDDAAALMPRRGSFWGVSRRGSAPLTAELSIELRVPVHRRKRFHGGPLAGVSLAHDPKPLARVTDAIRAAKLPHERVLIDLSTAFERQLYGAVQ